MALGSRLSAIDIALRDKIDAGTDATVTVTRGHPGEHLSYESVWIADITFDERSQHLGNDKRRQDLNAVIVCRVRQDGDDYPALRTRVCEIADDVEEALRADDELAQAVNFGGISAGAMDSFSDTDGRVAAVELTYSGVAVKG